MEFLFRWIKNNHWRWEPPEGLLSAFTELVCVCVVVFVFFFVFHWNESFFSPKSKSGTQCRSDYLNPALIPRSTRGLLSTPRSCSPFVWHFNGRNKFFVSTVASGNSINHNCSWSISLHVYLVVYTFEPRSAARKISVYFEFLMQEHWDNAQMRMRVTSCCLNRKWVRSLECWGIQIQVSLGKQDTEPGEESSSIRREVTQKR